MAQPGWVEAAMKPAESADSPAVTDLAEGEPDLAAGPGAQHARHGVLAAQLLRVVGRVVIHVVVEHKHWRETERS